MKPDNTQNKILQYMGRDGKRTSILQGHNAAFKKKLFDKLVLTNLSAFPDYHRANWPPLREFSSGKPVPFR
jgi:hypothetical protein